MNVAANERAVGAHGGAPGAAVRPAVWKGMISMGRMRAIAISRLPRMTVAVALACTLLAASPGVAGFAGTYAASRVAVPGPDVPKVKLCTITTPLA